MERDVFMISTRRALIGFAAGLPVVAAIPFAVHGWELGPLQMIEAAAGGFAWAFISLLSTRPA